MNVYTCTDHEGFWPVGVCSVVVAKTEDEAHELLRIALKEHGLTKELPFTLRKVNTEQPQAFLLLDGDY
jgi:hypothetical protein